MESAGLAEIPLRLVGAFYVFAGYFATRVTLMTAFTDNAAASISGVPPARMATLKAAWLLLTSTLVLAGGVLLALLINGAQWVFLVSVIIQFAYLFALAPRYFDKFDAPTASGRRQNVNAFFIYCSATFFVLWAAEGGYLRPIAAQPRQVLLLAVLAMLAHVIFVVRGLRR